MLKINQSINENKFRVISKSFIKRFLFLVMSRVGFFAAMYNNALCNVILIHKTPMCLLLFAFVLFCSVYTCIFCIALIMFYLLLCVYSHSHPSFVYEHMFFFIRALPSQLIITCLALYPQFYHTR